MNEYKVLVVYRTKHGSTRRYAGWIADALDADIVNGEENGWEQRLSEYDTIIYGGNLNESGINGIAKFRARTGSHPDQNIVYFAVGSFPPSEDTVVELVNANFPEHLRSQVKLFHFRGRLDFLGLGFWEKFLMRGFQKRLLEREKKQGFRTETDNELLMAFEQEMDWSDKTTIQPLVDYVKAFMTPQQLQKTEQAAAVRMAETEKREEQEARDWEEEQKRREALFLERQEKEKEGKLRRLNKKQRAQYEENKARRESMEQAEAEKTGDAEEDFTSEDDYSDFYDEDEKRD